MGPGVDIVIAASQDLGTGSPTRSRPELEAAIVLNVPLRTRTNRVNWMDRLQRMKSFPNRKSFLKTGLQPISAIPFQLLT